MTTEILQALRGVRFIAQHIKDADKDNEVVQEWKFVSMVLDRFFLWVFTLSCIGGTLGIILQSPSLYDTRLSMYQTLSEIPNRKNNFIVPSDIRLTIIDEIAAQTEINNVWSEQCLVVSVMLPM